MLHGRLISIVNSLGRPAAEYSGIEDSRLVSREVYLYMSIAMVMQPDEQNSILHGNCDGGAAG